MRKRIEEMERELADAGHEVEREFVDEGLEDSHDGAGWIVRVDGEVVASGSSIGALEDALRAWIRGELGVAG